MQHHNDHATFVPQQEIEKAVAPSEATHENHVMSRKPFVEPAVSDPTDVLEATKYFAQAVASGSL